MSDESKLPFPESDSCPVPPRPVQTSKRFNKIFIVVLFAVTLVLFLSVIKIFFIPIVIAAVFATLFHPLYLIILGAFRDRRNFAAIATCIVLFLILLIPLTFISNVVAKQAVELYDTAVPRVTAIIQQGDAGVLGRVRSMPAFKRYGLDRIDWQESFQKSLQVLGSTVASIVNRTSQATISFIVNVFVIFFVMFYFFRDGDGLVNSLRGLLPINDVYKDKFISRFYSISRATVKGTLIIGLIQGTLGALTLLVFGVDTWVLWGFVMVLASIIPVVGTWTVLVPAGIIKIVAGQTLEGIVMIFMGAVVISSIDNIIRPALVGRDAGMHDLLIFFTTLGGIALYGFMGFIVGPVIAVFFLTMLDIYAAEFRCDIDAAQKIPAAPAHPAPPR